MEELNKANVFAIKIAGSLLCWCNSELVEDSTGNFKIYVKSDVSLQTHYNFTISKIDSGRLIITSESNKTYVDITINSLDELETLLRQLYILENYQHD